MRSLPQRELTDRLLDKAERRFIKGDGLFETGGKIVILFGTYVGQHHRKTRIPYRKCDDPIQIFGQPFSRLLISFVEETRLLSFHQDDA